MLSAAAGRPRTNAGLVSLRVKSEKVEHRHWVGSNLFMTLLKILRRRNAPQEEIVLRIEIGRESDQRWIVDVVDLPGVMSYGATKQEAIDRAGALALRVIDERIEHGEPLPKLDYTEVPLTVR